MIFVCTGVVKESLTVHTLLPQHLVITKYFVQPFKSSEAAAATTR